MTNFFNLTGAPEFPFDQSQISEFGEATLFNNHTFGKYQINNIDFVKLVAFIKEEKDAIFDYTRFIGYRTLTYTRTVGGGMDAKFDRMVGNLFTETKTVPTTHPIVDTKKTLNLNGKLNKGLGEVALNSDNNPNGIGGLELTLNLDDYEVQFYLHFYYKGKKRIYQTSDDGTYIAFSISTPNAEDFDLLEEHIGKVFLIGEFRNKILEQFNGGFSKASSNYKKLSWLYRVAPVFIIKERGNEQLYADFELILEQMSHYRNNDNYSKSLFSIFKEITPAYLFERFKADQAILFTMLDKLDEEYIMPFMQIVTNLSTAHWAEQDWEKTATVIVGRDGDHMEYYITRLKPAYDLTGKILPKGKVNFQNIHGAIDRVGYEGTVWVKTHHLDPLCPLWVRRTEGKDFWIPAIVFEPFIRKAERGAKVKFITDIVFVFATAGSLKILQSASPLFLRVLAAIELGKAPVDLAMESRLVKASLEKSDAGKWFLQSWPMISLVVDVSTLSADLLYGLIKSGPEVTKILKNNGEEEAAKRLDDVIDEAEELLSERLQAKIEQRAKEFIHRVNQKTTSIVKLTTKEISDVIKGYTDEADEIAEAIAQKRIHVEIWEDEDYIDYVKHYGMEELEMDELQATFYAFSVDAFAFGKRMVFKESTRPEKFMTQLVHEGTHTLENWKAQNWLAEGVPLKEVKAKIGTTWDKEDRAFINEWNFQEAAGMPKDFKSIGEIKTHVRTEYDEK